MTFPIWPRNTSGLHKKIMFALLGAGCRCRVPLRAFGQRSAAQRWRSTSGGQGASGPAEAPLPLLQRPLGVTERPQAHTKSWEDTRKELVDEETRLRQREHLLKEASKGYFTDLNATRRHGGKSWIAPNVMIREDKALYFPNVTGSRLDTREQAHTTDMCQRRVSVIAMLSTRMSEVHVKGFVAPTNARYLSSPRYQYIQINLQENLLKSWLVSLFLASIARSVPRELHPTYLVSKSEHGVYENLKVRWAGCADAKVEETRALEQCAGVLINRLEKKNKS
ncbi:ATP10 protein-domain-containing protein [Pisolithus sp. B1]|nr:ATP10 protein-domain-containing protein [Pisolithus sp. B1]